jgi:hypothetical protein
MNMSISPAQMVLQVASSEGIAPTGRSASAPVSKPAPAAVFPAESAASAPHEVPPAQFNTDLQIDSQHQIYYEFVDASTGDVVFEIPPAALREIGESLHLPVLADAAGQSVDVKS